MSSLFCLFNSTMKFFSLKIKCKLALVGVQKSCGKQALSLTHTHVHKTTKTNSSKVENLVDQWNVYLHECLVSPGPMQL